MAQLRDIKRHIASVNKIKQITKAMYAISMTRVFKTKQQLSQARIYTQAQLDSLREVIGVIPPEHLYLQARGEGKYVFVVNADRGLCGRFKGDLNRHAEGLLGQTPQAKLILGGEKAELHFRKSRFEVARQYLGLYDKPAFTHAEQIAADLMALYRETQAPIEVVYMRFVNDFRQHVTAETLLPLSVSPPEEGTDEPDDESPLTLYEPDQNAVFEALVPLVVRAQLYRMLLESKTSEHAIRRQAMRNATDNADELIQSLTLQFNKARQAEITKQLFDIMGGAEALRPR